jgi:hypothetical protein
MEVCSTRELLCISHTYTPINLTSNLTTKISIKQRMMQLLCRPIGITIRIYASVELGGLLNKYDNNDLEMVKVQILHAIVFWLVLELETH